MTLTLNLTLPEEVYSSLVTEIANAVAAKLTKTEETYLETSEALKLMPEGWTKERLLRHCRNGRIQAKRKSDKPGSKFLIAESSLKSFLASEYPV